MVHTWNNHNPCCFILIWFEKDICWIPGKILECCWFYSDPEEVAILQPATRAAYQWRNYWVKPSSAVLHIFPWDLSWASVFGRLTSDVLGSHPAVTVCVLLQMKSTEVDQGLFTDSYCKVCSAQLISESQRVAHYEVRTPTHMTSHHVPHFVWLNERLTTPGEASWVPTPEPCSWQSHNTPEWSHLFIPSNLNDGNWRIISATFEISAPIIKMLKQLHSNVLCSE